MLPCPARCLQLLDRRERQQHPNTARIVLLETATAASQLPLFQKALQDIATSFLLFPSKHKPNDSQVSHFPGMNNRPLLSILGLKVWHNLLMWKAMAWNSLHCNGYPTELQVWLITPGNKATLHFNSCNKEHNCQQSEQGSRGEVPLWFSIKKQATEQIPIFHRRYALK